MNVNFTTLKAEYLFYSNSSALYNTNNRYNNMIIKRSKLINTSPSISYEIRLNQCKINAFKNSRNMDQMKEYYQHLDACMYEKPAPIISSKLANDNAEICVTKIEMVKRYFYDHVWKYTGYTNVPVEKKICS